MSGRGPESKGRETIGGCKRKLRWTQFLVPGYGSPPTASPGVTENRHPNKMPHMDGLLRHSISNPMRVSKILQSSAFANGACRVFGFGAWRAGLWPEDRGQKKLEATK